MPQSEYIVRVEERHIKQGAPGQSGYCPIALAVKELEPESEVFVGSQTVVVDGYWYKLPPEAAAFVKEFDQFGGIFNLEPISFTIKKKLPGEQIEIL